MTKVVNIRYDKYDQYIGRAGHNESGLFGNPHTMGGVYCSHCKGYHDREGAIAAFKKDFLIRIENDPEYKKRVLELKDKVLGCFCKRPNGSDIPCHGDVYKEWLDNYDQN
jgi:hypothetical protein